MWFIDADDTVGGSTLSKICLLIKEYPELGLINVTDNPNLKDDYKVY